MTRPEPTAISPLATSSPRVHRPAAEPAVARRMPSGSAEPMRAGVSLDLASLPGKDGIGDVGATARDFVDWIARAGQRIWRLSPTVDTSDLAVGQHSDRSSFAGDTRLIDLDDLVQRGLLGRARRPMHLQVDSRRPIADRLSSAASWKLPLIEEASRRLLALPHEDDQFRRYMHFCEREAWWLADHVAFHAMREEHDGAPRAELPRGSRIRTLGANRGRSLDIGATHRHAEAAAQFLYDEQMRQLHAHAHASGVWLMRDVPSWVNDDSADVWANHDLFQLDGYHLVSSRMGVPPSPAEPAGQIWPSLAPFDWKAHAKDGFEWWIQRLRRAHDTADLVQITHARKLADWWSVPAHAAYAELGRWEPGPGVKLLDTVSAAIEGSRFMLDDLGVATPALDEMLERTSMPRMRVLTQGFTDGSDSTHLPAAWCGDEIATTVSATHASLHAWAQSAERARRFDPDDERLSFALRLTGARTARELPKAAVAALLASPARHVIIPMRDWIDAEHGVPTEPLATPTMELTDELAETMRRTTQQRRPGALA